MVGNTDVPPVEKVKPDEVKPKAKSKPRAKVKAKVKEEVNEEVRTIEDGATRKAQPCLSSVKQEVKEEDDKPKHRNRPELKEKANCPACGKELTAHGLKYTHKRFCKANQPEQPALEKQHNCQS